MVRDQTRSLVTGRKKLVSSPPYLLALQVIACCREIVLNTEAYTRQTASGQNGWTGGIGFNALQLGGYTIFGNRNILTKITRVFNTLPSLRNLQRIKYARYIFKCSIS